jgi:hypothetical protein
LAAVVLSAWLVVGCVPSPSLNAVLPGSGYPRQLLAVDGTTLFASVVWDVGLATETVLYNGLFGTRYFQIPATATAGTHPVALRNSRGTSSSQNVTVLASSGTFPAPRIEDVGLRAVSGTGPVNVLLVVTAANLDVDATMTVEGATPQMVLTWGGLPVDFQQAHVPATFGYPVYHYLQFLAAVDTVALGSTLDIVVTNTDGLADTTSYTLPAALTDLDSDGDGLLDDWEETTYTAPTGGTVPLDSLGTSKWRKDILIEVDWIGGDARFQHLEHHRQRIQPGTGAEPGRLRGVRAIIDHGQGAPFSGGGTVLADHTTMDFGRAGPRVTRTSSRTRRRASTARA